MTVSRTDGTDAGRSEPAGGIRRPPILALVAISALSPFAINVIVPSMPALERHFSADYGTVQLVLSLFLVAVAAGQIFVGPLSDRFGRRPVLLLGFLIFTLASLAAVFAQSIAALIALRIVQGASGCVGIALGRAIIRDLYDRRQAASMIGYVTMGMAMAPMLAPFFGGVLQETQGWRAVFVLMTAFGLVCLLVTVRWIPETNFARTPVLNFGTMLRDFRILGSERDFVLFTASTGLTAGVFFSFLGGAPYVAERILDLSPSVYGLWFSLLAIGYALGNFLSARFSERFGLVRMILYGSYLGLASIAVAMLLFAAGFGSPSALFLPMAVSGIANGVVLPNSLSGAISVRPEIAGAAAGLTGAVQIGAGAVLSALVGMLLEGSTAPFPMFAVMIPAAAVALAAAYGIRHRRPAGDPAG
ncbi:multidrug effflux MFS transporter [Faunimonas sp. B44]|uniref:multidrug effflux MFS transporter n=1 Tax=Faunimonas sp. B44 TaxID=3461493 RepID=UPI004043E5B7